MMQNKPGGYVMKTLSLAIISAAIVLASCSSTKNTAASEYDDVYYNPNKVKRQEAAAAQARHRLEGELAVLVGVAVSGFARFRFC